MKLRPPPDERPLLTANQAAKLLDEVVYERICEFVDFTAIHAFECELAQLLEDLVPPTPTVTPGSTATAMVTAALARLPSDPRRELGFAAFGDDDCPLCAVEAASHDTHAKERDSPIARS